MVAVYRAPVSDEEMLLVAFATELEAKMDFKNAEVYLNTDAWNPNNYEWTLWLFRLVAGGLSEAEPGYFEEPIGCSEVYVFVHDGDRLSVNISGCPRLWKFELADPKSIDHAMALVEHALRTDEYERRRRAADGWSWDENLGTPYGCQRRSLGIIPPGLGPARNHN